MVTGGLNTNDDRELDENYDKMRYDEKYDECNFRERVSRNPSVSGLIEKIQRKNQIFLLNKKHGQIVDSQNSMNDEKMKKDTENLNGSQGDNVISNGDTK